MKENHTLPCGSAKSNRTALHRKKKTHRAVKSLNFVTSCLNRIGTQMERLPFFLFYFRQVMAAIVFSDRCSGYISRAKTRQQKGRLSIR